MNEVLGIHHVTAIAGDPQRNLDFYAGVLGLRLLKRTANVDDPKTSHLYYGDERGSPGTILTFLPRSAATRGRHGVGQIGEIALSIPDDSLDFWRDRLRRHDVQLDGPALRGRGSERVLAFEDPDGLRLELVAHSGDGRPGWDGEPAIPVEHAIRGFHDVTIWVEDATQTERVLADALGFRCVYVADETRSLAVGDGGPGRMVRLRTAPEARQGEAGAGVVHHLAFATSDEVSQRALQSRALEAGLSPTPVIDWQYCRSMYFFGPAGVLFEVATVSPGFAVHEPADLRGESSKLPPQLELHRAELGSAAPTFRQPAAERLAATDGAPRVASEPPPELGFTHVHVPPVADCAGATRGALLLLHGVGGDEHHLIPLGRALLPGAAMLSPRGRVLERGAPRFFRRLAEGVVDQEDLARRTDELADFVGVATARYDIDGASLAVVGFSNGANIAASLLLRHPGLFRRAVLMSPMAPFEPDAMPDLRGTRVFIGAGRHDPVVPGAQTEHLAMILRNAGAEVTVHWTDVGHVITRTEITAARAWLARHGARAVGANRAAAEAPAPAALGAG